MKKRIVMLLCCLCVLGTSFQVNANESTELPSLVIEENGSGETVGNQYNSVLQVVVTYTDDEENEIPLQGGSAFFIGDDETQLQYIITSSEVAVVSEETKKSARKKYKIKKDEEIEEQIKVVINKDVTIDASVVTSSEEMDFAILQLSQPVHDRQALLLNDKEAKEYLGKVAYALGYPGAIKVGEDMTYYTSIDLQQTEGFLEVEEIVNGQKYIRHHIFPNYGNLGGPIIDQNGAVVALNQAKNDGKSFYALEITEIMHVMDSLGIPYKTVTQIEAEEAAIAKAKAEAEAAALAAIVHKEELSKVISEAESLDLSDYKKKSIVGFTDCLEDAKEIYEDEDATQKQVDKAVEDMREVINGLILKTPLKIVLSIIAAVFCVCVVVILIILKATSKVRKERKEKRKADFTVTEPAPVFETKSPMLETSYKDIVEAGNRQVTNQNIWNMQMQDAEGTDQTTILSNYSDSDNCQEATSVLMKEFATLIRCSNDENILINKFPFAIGKDKTKVDYFVQNNMAVSRVHAVLLCENNSYFIQDNNATNGTFVNGNRLAPGSRAQLQHNDRICLGNENFDIKLGNN